MTESHIMLRVLLVEECDADAKHVQDELLETTNTTFEIVHVHSCEEGRLQLLSEKIFDVALLDLHLADAGGVEAVEALLSTGTQVPIVVLSGSLDVDLSMEAVNAGAQDYLVKGEFDGPTLLRAVRHAIERRRLVQQFAYMAHHDSLTGLPNRASLAQVFTRAKARARRANRRLGLLYLDLDYFKEVNDTHGHEAGDEVLVEVAERLRQAVRQADVVVRLGGDEFVVLVEDLSRPGDAVQVGEKLIASLSKPIKITAGTVQIGASVGYAIARKDADTLDGLLRRADAALYRAKESGRGIVKGEHRFHGRQGASSPARPLLELVRRAVDTEAFALHYQPILSLQSGRTVASEALLRLNQPDGRLRTASELMPALAAAGLLATVEGWTLLHACAYEATRRARGEESRQIGVNVSAAHLREADVLQEVVEALETSGLPPADLSLDLSYDALRDEAPVTAKLTALAQLGVTLVLDGYGKGPLSLARFVDLPIQQVKLHPALVRSLASSQQDQLRVGRLISLAHSIGLDVGAGRVEEPQEREALRALGCDRIQGYLTGRPVPAQSLLRRQT